MSEHSAEKDAGRIDALRIESDGGVLILATRHDGQIEARTSSDRIVLDREAVVRLADWLTKHDPHAEKDAGPCVDGCRCRCGDECHCGGECFRVTSPEVTS